MRIRLFLLLAVAALAPSLFAATFGELVERYSNLTVGEATTVSATDLAIGHMKLTLAEGKAAPVMAGREVVGLFFEGKGTLQYDAATPAELPVVAFNTRKESNLKYEGDAKHAVLSGPVNEVLLLS